MGDPQPVFNIVVTGAGLEPERHERLLLVRDELVDPVERYRDRTLHRTGAGRDAGR